MTTSPQTFVALRDVYGVLGTMLLTPPTQLDEQFMTVSYWESFPHDIENEAVREGLGNLTGYLEKDDPALIEQAALEYTRLFIGPPSPMVPPWETLVKDAEGEVGYGKPAVEMHRLLSSAGLQVAKRRNQYPDHIGIELLYAAYLCDRIIAANDLDQLEIGSLELHSEDPLSSDLPTVAYEAREALAYLEAHPLSWIGEFRGRVEQAASEGYLAAVVKLSEGVLRKHEALLRELVE